MLELVDICVDFGRGVRALDRVSLQIRPGELTVLLGPSGAGKSTLLRCCNLLTRPSAGRVRVAGNGNLIPGAALRAHRRRTAMVFQQHQLIAQASVLRNVVLGRLGYYGTLRSLLPLPASDYRTALESLERVNLLDKALVPAASLSGGQQQRVGIARALTQEPRLVLADEPVASLDPAAARSVLALLRRVCREDGITAIVSLHQVAFAREFADRIVGLTAGAVVFDGAAADLTDHWLARIYGPADHSGETSPRCTAASLQARALAAG